MKLMFKNAVVLLGEGRYLGDGYVVTDGKFIKSVSDSRPEGSFDREIDCRGKLLMPAFYNIHCHAAMTLFRGIGEDLPLQRWLNEKIYPAEDRLTPESVRVGTELAIAEMIRGGCASFSDMYFFSDETAEAVLDSGMKANISRCLVSFSDDATIVGDPRFEEAKRLFVDFHNSGDGRVKIDAAVHAEYTIRRNIAAKSPIGLPKMG